MYHSPTELRDERRRRLLYGIFAFALVASALICAGVGLAMLTPDDRMIRLGAMRDFASASAEPVDIAVDQLDVSRLIPNRPSLSEDIVFVVRDNAEYRAFLGIDPPSGCFLSWR